MCRKGFSLSDNNYRLTLSVQPKVRRFQFFLLKEIICFSQSTSGIQITIRLLSVNSQPSINWEPVFYSSDLWKSNSR